MSSIINALPLLAVVVAALSLAAVAGAMLPRQRERMPVRVEKRRPF